MIRFSKGFGKDNTCKDKPLHGGIGTMCVFVCVCVCLGEGEGGGGGGDTPRLVSM